MVLYTDVTHLEHILSGIHDMVTVYLLGSIAQEALSIKAKYLHRIKSMTSIRIAGHSPDEAYILIAKLILAEKQISRCKVYYDFGDEKNAIIDHILYPDRKPKRKVNKYSEDFKKQTVGKWMQLNKPSIAAFVKEYGVSESTFRGWVSIYMDKVEKKLTPVIIDTSRISYYEDEESGDMIPYLYDAMLHDVLYQKIIMQGIFLEQMEVCAIEELAITFAREIISEDNCIYHPCTYKEFYEYMMGFSISERVKNNLPVNIIKTIFHIREQHLKKKMRSTMKTT